MVIVFDNIDRVQGDVAISMLSTIKTFMFSGPKGLVFIVPCDAEAIEAQIGKFFNTDLKGFDATEYLRKIFNLIVWVPEFIATDMEEYTKACLAATGDISSLINNEDVVLVINSAFSRSPREIIQFVNNLVATAITVQGTGVSSIINDNMGYLAKVLVLRQKFPIAYKRLREKWYQPESIATGDELEVVDSELVKFMNKTNRITVEDAEPFIYFKDPSKSRGLKKAVQLKNALVSGDVSSAIEIVKPLSSEHGKVIDFITDLIEKYSGQETVLLNVVNSQFQLLKELSIDTSSKKYLDTIARAIDGQLWGSYQDLPIDDIFNIIPAALLDTNLRKALIERFIASVETKELKPVTKKILENLRDNASILSSEQLNRIKYSLETNYTDNEDILAIYTTTKSQDKFITAQHIEKYVEGIDYTNIKSRMETVKSYKDFIIEKSLVKNVIERVAERLTNNNSINPDFNPEKKLVIDAIGTLSATFRLKLKEYPDEMHVLVTSLVQAYRTTSNAENWVPEIIAMRWLKGFVNDTDKAELATWTQEFIGKTIPDAWIQFIRYWDEPTRQNIISDILPYIITTLSSDTTTLKYIYENANDASKTRILSDVIQRTPVGNTYDIDFISNYKQLPDRINVLSELLEKANRQPFSTKKPYYDYLSNKIRKNDPRTMKDSALEQIKTLLTTSDTAQTQVGADFLHSLTFITDSDKREVAKYALNWLREPGRIVDSNQQVTLAIITENFELLQDTLKNDYTYFLFNLLDGTKDLQTVEIILATLSVLSPAYEQFKKDYDDLLVRLQTWPQEPARVLVLKTMPSFAAKKQKKDEREFWSAFESLDAGTDS